MNLSGRNFGRGRPQNGPRRASRRHDRMLERSLGHVVRRKPVTGKVRAPRRPFRREPFRVWMFSRHLRKYLGCSVRHIYWLTSKRRLPYHVFNSTRGPLYIFKRAEVNWWLRRYRGKGRQLGLRKLRQWRQLGRRTNTHKPIG